jgi:hypothetical protein
LPHKDNVHRPAKFRENRSACYGVESHLVTLKHVTERGDPTNVFPFLKKEKYAKKIQTSSYNKNPSMKMEVEDDHSEESHKYTLELDKA